MNTLHASYERPPTANHSYCRTATARWRSYEMTAMSVTYEHSIQMQYQDFSVQLYRLQLIDAVPIRLREKQIWLI